MKQQVAIYLRLSQEDVDIRTSTVKDVSNSITSQRLFINRHLDQTPALCNLPRVEFCDDGFSGTNFDRPGFIRMIELAKRGEISCIVVKDLSRFGRDYLEVGNYLEHIFPFLGIRFKAINDHYDSAKHPWQTLSMGIAFSNLVYDYYSKDLSKKVKSAMNAKQRDCCYVSCVPFGYRVNPEKKHHLVIDPETAPIVRRVFLDIIAGQSSSTIAKELNREGIPTPAMSKNITRRVSTSKPQWTHQTILSLINNIKYTGTMVNHIRESRCIRDKNSRRVPKDEWYIKENTHEAIVTLEEYNAAQNAIRHRRKSSKVSHDQSDRVYFCAHCGYKLEKMNGTIFACPSHRYHDNSPCEGVHWRKEALEHVVFESLKQQIQLALIQPASPQSEPKQRENFRAQLSILRAQLDSLEREKFSLYEQYREGTLSRNGYLQGRNALTEKQRTWKEQLAECEARFEQSCADEKAAALRLDGVKKISGLSDEQLRQHLYDGIEKILVYDASTIEIMWKFNEPAFDADSVITNNA